MYQSKVQHFYRHINIFFVEELLQWIEHGNELGYLQSDILHMCQIYQQYYMTIMTWLQIINYLTDYQVTLISISGWAYNAFVSNNCYKTDKTLANMTATS